jgi:hypothetical protein
MAVFLSYAHQDAEKVEGLRQDLEDLAGEVWLDRRLVGGQAWWAEILRQLRGCSLYVLALSAHSVRSEACLAELRYASSLRRPLLVLQIDDVELAKAPEEARATQVVDCRMQDVRSIKALAKALRELPTVEPLPDPIPEPPLMPQSYADRFSKLFHETAGLTLTEQLEYSARLRFDIENGRDVVDATRLLAVLYDRPDLSWKVRSEMETFMASRAAAGGKSIHVETPRRSPQDEPSILGGAGGAAHDAGGVGAANHAAPLPSSPERHLQWGNEKANRGDLEAAIAEYAAAIHGDSNCAAAFFNRGLIRSRRGDFEGSIVDYNEAIRARPSHADAYNNRGVARFSRGDTNGAIIDYDEALRINPQHALALRNRELAQAGHEGVASGLATPAGWFPDPSGRYELRYWNGDMWTEHVSRQGMTYTDYDEAMRVNPQHARALKERGLPQAGEEGAAGLSTPARWFRDPFGRYELRYWDGNKWTEHVSQHGLTNTDPPLA